MALGQCSSVYSSTTYVTSLKNASICYYADDLKPFVKIDTTEDCDVLQANLDRLQAWCVANNLALSIHKCSAISFSRRATADHIQWPYVIAFEPLLLCQQVNDFGVLMDSRLTFKPHSHQVVQRAKATWAFMKRQAKKFKISIAKKLRIR